MQQGHHETLVVQPRHWGWCRAPIFGEDYTDLDVIQSLLGNQSLPWEMSARAFDPIPNPAARNLIRNLLR